MEVTLTRLWNIQLLDNLERFGNDFITTLI